MKRMYSSVQLIAASFFFFFIISLSPAGVDAVEIHVPKDFRTIQDAVSSQTFTSGDTIVVAPGIYFGPINLPKNITIKGSETARTFLSGNGSGPVVVVDGTANNTDVVSTGIVNVHNFTFVNAVSGISILDNNSVTSINITNNVFQLGFGGTAISVLNSPLTTVANNTFHQNAIALSCDWDINISNNIFSLNTTAIAYSSAFIANINNKNNAFFGNAFSGTNPIVGNPLFVDPANHDFHLKEGSPCIINPENTSTTSDDIGAYSGSSADTIPFPVSGLTITSTTNTSISLTWLPNLSSRVTNSIAPGGYQIYFGSAPGNYNGTLASGGTATSPVNAGSVTSYTLEGLTYPTTTLTAPDSVQSTPLDSRLVLTWPAVTGATGYKLHYGISSLDENVPIDVGNTTSYELAGLTNGQYYLAAVSAYAQQKYYIVVTAYDNQFKDSTSTPLLESVYSTETSAQIGPMRESGLSPVKSDFPEAVITYPALPDSGGRCFIATAAYGYYSAPEVQALRIFRDRYLLASAAGRMFVQWYYRHGPAAAALLNGHPGCKPIVRAALLPFVGTAIFMTETSMLFKAVVFLSLGAAIAFGFFRKRCSGTGGLR